MQRKVEHDRISNLDGARREGEEIGQQKGQQIGEEKKAIEIARKMKEMGISFEQIHTATGLPTETIERM
jgi:predicted transposase/invertase (TIGR01784 family)